MFAYNKKYQMNALFLVIFPSFKYLRIIAHGLPDITHIKGNHTISAILK